MAEVLTFGPFTRSVSSVEAHLAPAECLAAGSYNYMIDPVAGGAFKRSGSLTVGDTVTAGYRSVAGILESAPEYVPCRLRAFKSDALADGASGGGTALLRSSCTRSACGGASCLLDCL